MDFLLSFIAKDFHFPNKGGHNLFFSMRFSHEMFHTTKGTVSKGLHQTGANPGRGRGNSQQTNKIPQFSSKMF